MSNLQPPRIEKLRPKTLVGKRLSMSMAADQTPILWKSFMPFRKSILHTVSSDLISMQVYDEGFDFNTLTPETIFTKWATVEVSEIENLPEGMETYSLNGGLYAVFHFVGGRSEVGILFNYIFQEWMPQSDYIIDTREHFEVLGEKYRNNDPGSEEDFWIPIRLRSETSAR